MDLGWLGPDGGLGALLTSDWTSGAVGMAVLFTVFGIRAKLAGDESVGGCSGGGDGSCAGDCGSCDRDAPGETTNHDCRMEVTP